MKFSITATIPTTQYGNIQPAIETEAETYEEARDLALSRMEELWDRYCENGKQLRKAGERVKLKAYVGGEIYFEPQTHTYTNESGERYTSGSEYAQQFEEPFDQDKIAAAMAKKHGVKAEDIIAMWKAKSDISRGIGTALHAAMEMYGRYNGLAVKMSKTAIHDSPMVLEAVKQFYEAHPEGAIYEALVVDHHNKRAGRIDRLVNTDKGFYIEDFKTDVAIDKRLPVYSKQLSFYAAILRDNGQVVAGSRVHHWDGKKWATHELKVLPV